MRGTARGRDTDPHAPQYDGTVRFVYAALSVLAFAALMAAVVFGAAGRMDLPWAWATIGVCGGMMAAMAATIDPGTRRGRDHFPASYPRGNSRRRSRAPWTMRTTVKVLGP